MNTKSTGNDKTFETQESGLRMEVVRLKLIEAGSIWKKMWEPSLCFAGLYLLSFIHFLRRIMNCMIFFFHWNLGKLGENFHKYIFVMLFLTWILFFINVHSYLTTSARDYVFYQVEYPLTTSLSPICVMQLRCSLTKAYITQFLF